MGFPVGVTGDRGKWTGGRKTGGIGTWRRAMEAEDRRGQARGDSGDRGQGDREDREQGMGGIGGNG